MGGYSTNDYPFNSNNPYFGVIDWEIFLKRLIYLKAMDSIE
jgi:hypothetical protein